MDKVQQLTEQFSRYTPNVQVAHQFAHWVVHHQVQVKITPKRKSKRGDYRAPYKQHGHRITINGDLNPYAFSVTFIHEMAHLYTWKQFQNKVLPHGIEWKSYFKQLMEPFLANRIFPQDIQAALQKYMANPAAATCRDEQLMGALAKYDQPLPQGWTVLKELALGDVFQVEDGRVFRKEEQLRKNFRCLEIATGKHFRISPQMLVHKC